MKRGNFSERLRAAADVVREAAREAADTAAERAREHVDRGLSPERMEATAGYVRKVGKVAPIVLPFAPIEVLLPAAGIAAIIKLADEKGLLETDKAAPLKEIATQIDQQIAVDEQMLLKAVPALLEMKIVSRLFGEGKALQSLKTIAKLASESGSVRDVLRKWKAQQGPEAPGRDGL